MLAKERLRIALQKKGRLNQDSLDLLARCGITFRIASNALFARCENLPIDILLVRDDDIPTLVMDGVCDLGIVGENVLLEKQLYQYNNGHSAKFNLIRKLGFSCCRLSIAFPEKVSYARVQDLTGLRIATSYPNLLGAYLKDHHVRADILSISGSVEIAPKLGMADAICDLVSSGRTLEENGLYEASVILQSQAVLIQSLNPLSQLKEDILDLMLRRVDGVLAAKESKYILFHAPRAALQKIQSILPCFESPTIIPLEGCDEKVSVHVVSPEGVFWKTLENLKQAGASSILVMPIEKMMR